MLVRTAQPLGTLAAFLAGAAVVRRPDDVELLRRRPEGGQGLSGAAAAEANTAHVGARAAAAGRSGEEQADHVRDGLRRRSAELHRHSRLGADWLDDGEHFLQAKEGRLQKVDAVTGRSQPFFDPDKLAPAWPRCRRSGNSGLMTWHSVAGVSGGGGGRRGGPPRGRAAGAAHLNAQRTAALFEYENDLYYCNLDGTSPVRLTKTPGTKELVTFSPDGKFVAFVRDNNLFVVDVATQTERALTTRRQPASSSTARPTGSISRRFTTATATPTGGVPIRRDIAFLRFDDTPVPQVHGRRSAAEPAGSGGDAVSEGRRSQSAGEARHRVRGRRARRAGPTWTTTPPTASLLTRAGWMPDSQNVYFYVQDRAQTWLDFCTVPRDGGETDAALPRDDESLGR